MNKSQIREIAKACFDAGKGDWEDSNFDEFFERHYKSAKINKDEVYVIMNDSRPQQWTDDEDIANTLVDKRIKMTGSHTWHVKKISKVKDYEYR